MTMQMTWFRVLKMGNLNSIEFCDSAIIRRQMDDENLLRQFFKSVLPFPSTSRAMSAHAAPAPSPADAALQRPVPNPASSAPAADPPPPPSPGLVDRFFEFTRRLVVSRVSYKRYVLESAVLFAVLFTVVVVPLQLAFHISEARSWWSTLDRGIDLIFLVNILVSFLTAVVGAFSSHHCL